MIPAPNDLVREDTKPAVLILDHDRQSVEKANACLRQSGYPCYASFDARSASGLISRHANIAILLASASEQRDYFHFADDILDRRNRERDFEVIFFSQKANQKQLLRALRMQACDFIHLPFDSKLLVGSIDLAARRLAGRHTPVNGARGGDQGVDPNANLVLHIQSMLRSMAEQLADVAAGGSVNGMDYIRNSNIRTAPTDKDHSLHRIAQERADNDQKGNSNTHIDNNYITKAYRIINAKKQFFFKKIDSDASLIMLLELYKVQEKEHEMPVTALCYSSGTAQTTALRRLESLEQDGFLKRHHDPADKRRILVRLTASGEKELCKYLAFINEIR